MQKRRNNSDPASTLQIALSTSLISISAILLAITKPTNTEKAPRQDLNEFQLVEGADADSITALGNYPDTSIPLSTDTTVLPDAAPTNTTSINVSSSTDFQGTLEGNPTTGVVRVTDAHPAGTYTVTVRAFNGGGQTAIKTFTLTVTTPPTCNPVSFAATNFAAGTNPTSVAVGDFNGDGKQDLAVANGGSNNVSILLGDGAGHFSAATNFDTGITPLSVAVGDFNGDGKQDLVVVNYFSNNVSILLGDGAGNFSAATNFGLTGSFPVSVTVGDFNGDSKQDLVVANRNSGNVAILLGDGLGNFSAPTNFGAVGNPSSVAVGDFNGDGKQDLAVANINSTNVSILLGDGAGHFSAATNFGAGSVPVSVAVGDFNGDGKQDLAVANRGSNNVSILLRICGPAPTPTPSPTPPTVTPTPTPTIAAQAVNLSTRMLVQTGDNVGIGGFIITGTAPKHVALRAFEPSLSNFVVPNPLADPDLELHGPVGFSTIISDTAWDGGCTYGPVSHPSGSSDALPLPSFLPGLQGEPICYFGGPGPNDLEPCICTTLNPGAYTAIVRGHNNSSGVALVEVLDFQPASSKLANISTRAFVSTGGEIMIAGFILGANTGQDNVIIRGIGPSLTQFGIPNALANPYLELRDRNGALIRANDNWQDDPAQAALITAAGLAPANPLESAIAETLAPGQYTALLSGVNEGTGIGVVEIYDLGAP